MLFCVINVDIFFPRGREQVIIQPKKENTYLIIGIMTGTSMDGIDISLCRFSFTEQLLYKPEIEVLDFVEYPFDRRYKQEVQEIINSVENSISKISALSYYLARIFAESVLSIIEKNGVDRVEVDAIAVHGQTVWHQPDDNFLGINLGHTFQTVNGSALHKLTQIPVVYDFRAADIALEGQGAPLLPIFDYHFFSDSSKNRGLLNVGGISNITILQGTNREKVTAFDLGPGNIIIDYVCQKYFNKPFDEGGKLAREGKILIELLALLQDDEYFEKPHPKSTGREKFGEKYFEHKFEIFQNLILEKEVPKSFLIAEDLLRTVTLFTAITIVEGILNFCRKENIFLDELLVSGGGSENTLLMETIVALFHDNQREQFPGAVTNVVRFESGNLNSRNKESVAFAYLGYLFLTNQSGNIISVTGAKQESKLGVIAF